jgi:nucleoside-diphosphate-sugar epimerase
MKRVLVNGASGFIGGHMVKRLKAEGHWVRAVDLKRHEISLNRTLSDVLLETENDRSWPRMHS